MRFKFPLIVFFVSIGYACMGQDPIWGKTFPCQIHSDIIDVALAPQQGVYAGGYFVGDLNINTKLFQSPPNAGDGFLLRMDSSGNVKWAHQIRATIGSGILKVNTDLQGNLFVLGGFDGQIFLPRDTLEGDFGSSNHFLIKYNQDGVVEWGKMFEHTLIRDFTTDSSGNVYMAVEDFNKPLTNLIQLHLLKLSSDGVVLSDVLVASADRADGSLWCISIARDALGNIVLLGEIVNSVNIEGVIYSSSGDSDPVLIKYTSEMNLAWVSILDQDFLPGLRSRNEVICDGTGNIYCIGILVDNSIITKYDAYGNKIWKLIPEQNGNDTNGYHFYNTSVTMDEEGDLLIAGTLGKGNFQLKGTVIPYPPNTDDASLLIKCSNKGDVIWSLTGGSPSIDYIRSIVRDPASGSVYFCGTFHLSTAQFGNIQLQGTDEGMSAFIVQIADRDFQNLKNSLGNDTTLCPGEPFVINTKKFISYSWQDGSTDSTFNVSMPGDYYLTATDFLGNVYQDTIHIAPCFESTTPNVITPNGDPMNEYLVFEQLDTSKGNVLTIYDRWGNQVYQSLPYLNDWNGEGMSRGVYYYVLFNASDRKKYKGWVQVMN